MTVVDLPRYNDTIIATIRQYERFFSTQSSRMGEKYIGDGWSTRELRRENALPSHQAQASEDRFVPPSPTEAK